MLPPARRDSWAYCQIEPSELTHGPAAAETGAKSGGGRCERVAILTEWRKQKTD